MSDLISRGKLLGTIEPMVGIWYDKNFWIDYKRVLEIIEDLPSAEPERKKGYWVPVTNGRGGFECDQCHNYAPSYQNGDEYLSYYCPHCGAEMTR